MRIRSSFAVLSLLAACLCVASSQAFAENISFFCSQDAMEVELGESVVEFPTPIFAFEGSDSVDVTVEAVLPPNWFWQICQVSTGVCYFQDVRINIEDFPVDELRVDLFPDTNTPGLGYLKVTITNVSNPSEKDYCTFTVFNGIPEADAHFEIPCEDNAAYEPLGTTLVEFFTEITNEADFEDDIQINLNTVFPDGWFGQFCQVSTGVCYFGDTAITLGAGQTDEIRVDFFPTDSGYGQIDLEVYSLSNPSHWRRCYFRLDVGMTTNVPDVLGAHANASSVAYPNPFTSETDIQFRLTESGPGQLEIYSAEGRKVRSFDGFEAVAGEMTVRWDGRDDFGSAVPSGVYFYRMMTSSDEAKGVIVRNQ